MLLVSYPLMFTPCMTPCFQDILVSMYSAKTDMGGMGYFLMDRPRFRILGSYGRSVPHRMSKVEYVMRLSSLVIIFSFFYPKLIMFIF